MITIERPNTVQLSGIKDTVSFGVKKEGLAHIFGILRNSLYSDKILAVIREYAANAVDAHVEAGKPTLPIEVTLPSRFNPVFKVRDFGLGLTDEDIHDIYAFYGESTKRKSNAMIGQLGLGSKSAFAYGDNFVITSFVDGVKTTYNAFIDASQIGQIAKLASEPTDQPNGVEISLAVKDRDTQEFHSKAFNLFRYFKVKPNVHGADFKYEQNVAIMSGADWAIYGKEGHSVAIMGNIGYPIDNHWVGDENITNTLAAGLEVDFAIGDLEISASREKLQYTDRTKKVIKDKLTRIVAEVAAELNKRFLNCATLFDAHKLYGSVMDYGSNLYALRGMVKNSLKFKGKSISGPDLRFTQPSDSSWVLRGYESTWRGNKIKSFVYNQITCSDKTMLVENDLNITAGVTNRVWNAVKVDNKKVYVLTYKDAAAKDAFFKETGIEQSNLVLLSSLPKISLATATGRGPTNAKHSSKEFTYDFNFKPGGWRHRKHSDYWTQQSVDVENDAGIYVIIDGFQYRDKNDCPTVPAELGEIVKSLKIFGISIPTIYGFKMAKRDIARKNKNMVLLWDYIATELTNYFTVNKVAQKLANRLCYDNNNSHAWMDFALRCGSKVSQKTCLARVAEAFNYMRHTADSKILDAAVKWKDYYEPTDKPEKDLKSLATEVDKTYPLFEFIRYWEAGKSQTNATIQYVDLIDG